MQHRKNPRQRHRAARESLSRRRDGRAFISPERRAGLALDWKPVGVAERAELDALPADVWLERVLNDPKIGTDAKAYACRIAESWREHGHLPEELFQ